MLFGKAKRIVERILIVEDEPLVAFDNEHFLTDAGFTIVATVDSAPDAVRAIDDEPIDLILADINLADGNGLDVARAAQAKGVPLLFVTGACPAEAQALAIGCLAKPYPQRALVAAIEAVDAKLAGRRLRKTPAGLTLFE